jgi:hypothetical protein
MSVTVFVPTKLFEFLKQKKAANKRIINENDNMMIANYYDEEINKKIYEFRQQDIFSYYKKICKNKYNFINAVTGFPQFFPDSNGNQIASPKITFIDDFFTKLIYETLLGETYKPGRITKSMYFDIKKVIETQNNTYYSFMFMYNLFSNMGFFGTRETKTLKEIYSQIFTETIKDLNRGYMNIYIEKTNETKIFRQEDGDQVFANFKVFLNEYLDANYNELDSTQIFKLKLALNFLRVQTSDAITLTILQLVLPGVMSNMGKYANPEWMQPANDYYFKISEDGNLVSCCKVFSLQYMDIRVNNKTLYQYNSIIINYVIDCDTMNCFVNINIIHANESKLTKLIRTHKHEKLEDSQKSALKYIYRNPNRAAKLPVESITNIDITDEKIKQINKLDLIEKQTNMEIDSKTDSQIFYFKYDISFGYTTYIQFIFCQVPNLYMYLAELNKITGRNSRKITDYIIDSSSVIVKKINDTLNDTENIFSIYQFNINGMPFYVPVFKIITNSRKYLIVYTCDISVIPEEVKQEYESFKNILEKWSDSHAFTTIYHTYKQSIDLSLGKISLFTLLLAFESLTNYIVIHKKITKIDIMLVSVESVPINLNNLLEYYYSIILQFEKIYNDVIHHKSIQIKSPTRKSTNTLKLRTSETRNSNTGTHRTIGTRKSNTGTHRTIGTRKLGLWSDAENQKSVRSSVKPNQRKPGPKMHSRINFNSSISSEMETRV